MRPRRFPLEAPPAHGQAVLDPDTSRHAVKVLRLRPGDAVVLFDGRGREWAGEVAAADRRGVRVTVGEATVSARTPGPRITLATAVPKGKRMSTLLSMATEAGVDRVVPVAFLRSAVRDVRPAKFEHWERTVTAAARQCGRAWRPELAAEASLADLLAAGAGEGERRLLATAGEAPLLSGFDLGGGTTGVTLLVGPEGGMTEAEREALLGAGFEPCSLGPHVLRVETAGVVAVGVIRGMNVR